MQGLAFEEGYRVIGTGMWLGLIMAANVWFVIWPNQKKALGIKPVDDETKAKAAKTAMMASRINFIQDRKSPRLNSSKSCAFSMPCSACKNKLILFLTIHL